MKKITCLICLGLMMGLLTSAQDDLIADPFTSSAPGSTAVDDEPMQSNAPDPDGIPVDGGLSLLLAGGAAYGVGKLNGRRKL